MKVSKSSLHYELYNKYTLGYTREHPDLCQYTRGVLRGILSCIGLVFVGSFLSWFFIVEPMASLLLWISGYGWTYFAIDGAALISPILITLGCLYYIVFRLNEVPLLGAEISTPSIVKTAYRGFKDKVCYMIDFV